MTAPVTSGWSILPGGACTHWESAAFARRTPDRTVVTEARCVRNETVSGRRPANPIQQRFGQSRKPGTDHPREAGEKSLSLATRAFCFVGKRRW